MHDDFLCGLSGIVVTACDKSYNLDRQGYNRAVQHCPLVINYCRTAKDVSNAVKWARRNKVSLRIRNGGHNYEGYSNGDGVLVIDVSKMTGIELDPWSNTVHVQGGVTNKLLYDFLWTEGYPFPGGTCPTVGVAGYALGGGWGLSCRAFGLGCDSIEEIELVNYEGKIIKANDYNNSDLFWALRGAGGGNFGVVTSITFRLPPRIQKVTLIEIDYLHADKRTQEEFLETWQDWICYADRRMTLISRIYNSETDGLAMVVRGIFYGKADEAACLLQDFLSIRGAVSNIEYMTFFEAITIIGSAYPDFEMFQSASRFVYNEFSSCQIRRIVDLIQNRPEGSVYVGLSMYALGGRAADMDVEDTAFYYRDAKYIIWLETIFEDPCYAKVNAAWIDRQFERLEPLTKGAYINFPYEKLRDFKREYFGDHAKRLEQIKKKYDPCNVFTFPQGLTQCDGTHRADRFSRTAFDVTEAAQAHVPKGKRNYRRFRYITPRD